MSLYLLSVSKSYNNCGKRVKVHRKPKNVFRAYYVNENNKLISKNLSKFEYFIFKLFKTKWKRRKFVCEECGHIFQALVKKSRDKVECPNC